MEQAKVIPEPVEAESLMLTPSQVVQFPVQAPGFVPPGMGDMPPVEAPGAKPKRKKRKYTKRKNKNAVAVAPLSVMAAGEVAANPPPPPPPPPMLVKRQPLAVTPLAASIAAVVIALATAIAGVFLR